MSIADIFGRPKPIKQDFSFTPETIDYEPSEGLLENIDSLQGSGTRQRDLGDVSMNQYRQMLDPGSSWYQGMFRNLRRNVGDMQSQTASNMNQALAQRGINRGGMSGLLNAININQSNEAIRKGTTDLLNQGMGLASSFGGLASGAYSGASQAYGQAGGLLGQIDANMLSADMQNASTQNAYQQYLRTSNYNQAVRNQNAQQAWVNNMLGLGVDIGTAFLTGGTSMLGSLMEQPASSINSGTMALPRNNFGAYGNFGSLNTLPLNLDPNKNIDLMNIGQIPNPITQ